MPDPIRILAFDASTAITGVVLVEYPGERSNTPKMLGSWAVDARRFAKGEDLRARLDRIQFTRERLYTLLSPLAESTFRPTVVAYETDTGRGHAPSEALVMAAGNYLTLPWCAGVPLVGITRRAACSAVGCDRDYMAPRGKTAGEQAEKIANLKLAVIQATARLFPGFRPDEWSQIKAEAIADALAVAAAVYAQEVGKRRVQAAQAAQRPLFGKGSRGPRKSKVAA